jgi:hypothetical protein
MILKIFLQKNLAKILAFFARTAATFCKNLIKTLFFEKNANFFAENWQKSQKIVIITSTPSQIFYILHTTGLPDGIFSNPKSNFWSVFQ